MNILWQDVRYAIRSLIAARGFSFVAVLTLCLGIGGNAVIFSLVNAVLLRPLPYPDAEQLVSVATAFKTARTPMAALDFDDYRAQAGTMAAMAAYATSNVNLASDEPERVRVLRASPTLFDVLRVPPLYGRTLAAGEDAIGAARVAVLTYGLWQRRFGSDPTRVGTTLTLDGTVFTIVGVLPPQVEFPASAPADIVIPLIYSSGDRRGRLNNAYAVVARLAPGVTVETAQQNLDVIAARLAQAYPDTNRERGVAVTSLHDQDVGRSRLALLVLLGAVVFVLLIACANVANLLLTRAVARQRELAIRASLGATRARILRQLVTEAVLLWTVAGCAGLVFAWAALPLVRRLAPLTLPRLATASLDWSVAAYAMALAMLTGVVFGLAPAWQAFRLDLSRAVSTTTAGAGGGRGASRLSGALVMAEVALALILATGAALMTQSVVHLLNLDLGFVPARLITMRIWPSPDSYSPTFGFSRAVVPSDDDRRRRPIVSLYRGILEAAPRVPGVEAAAAVSSLPLDGGITSGAFVREGEEDKNDTLVSYRIVSDEYFRVMDLPLHRGRAFTAQDVEESAKVAIVSASLARAYFRDRDPLGQRAKVMGEWREIVGIVGDVRRTIGEDPMPTSYLPILQEPWPYMTLVMRTRLDVSALVPSLQQMLRGLDPNLPVFDVRTMDDVRAASTAQPRFNLWLLGSFAALALVISAVGIYGVIAQWAGGRTREMALRMALGAKRGDILRLVLRRGMLLAASGIVIGLVGAFLLTRLMASMLFDVKPTEPLTFAGVSLLLLGVAALASYLPARRATRVPPMIALRDS